MAIFSEMNKSDLADELEEMVNYIEFENSDSIKNKLLELSEQLREEVKESRSNLEVDQNEVNGLIAQMKFYLLGLQQHISGSLTLSSDALNSSFRELNENVHLLDALVYWQEGKQVYEYDWDKLTESGLLKEVKK